MLARTSSCVCEAATNVQYSGRIEPMPMTISAMYVNGPALWVSPAPMARRALRGARRSGFGRPGAETLAGVLVMVMRGIAPGQAAERRTKRLMIQLINAMASRRASMAQATAADRPRCPRFQP